MAPSSNPQETGRENQKVAWSGVVRFVRQLSHDLRNNLNSLELQLTLINELSENAELKADVARSREMVAEMANALQKLTSTLVPGTPHFMPYRAADLVEDLQKQIQNGFPEQSSLIDWDVQLGDEQLQIDPILFLKALLDLVDNAFQFSSSPSRIGGFTRIVDGRFVWELREPKESFDLPTEDWGGEPLQGQGRGHYGLGLYHARILIEMQNGDLKAQFNSEKSLLATTVSLPLLAT